MKALATILASLLLGGCLVIPTPRHGVGVIPEAVLERLVPGTTTRTDVLLMLGDPARRCEDDRFFIYGWEETHAYVLAGGPGGGAGASLEDEHRLVLEFRRDGLLRQKRSFRSMFSFDKKDEDALESWMREQGPPQ